MVDPATGINTYGPTCPGLIDIHYTPDPLAWPETKLHNDEQYSHRYLHVPELPRHHRRVRSHLPSCGIGMTFGFQRPEISRGNLRKRSLLVSIRGWLLSGELNIPRFRYDISGAAGKEVAILDLYQGTGDAHLSRDGLHNLNLCSSQQQKLLLPRTFTRRR